MKHRRRNLIEMCAKFTSIYARRKALKMLPRVHVEAIFFRVSLDCTNPYLEAKET